MRARLRNSARVAGFFLAASWAVSARADGGAVLVDRPPVHHDDVFEKLFSKPMFLSMGAVASLANPEARGTLGGEITLNRWLDDDEIFTSGTGGYLQWEYVAGNETRVSFGSQINYGVLGIETGYAYQTLQEGRRNVSALQIAPFYSIGIAHVGLRVLAPVSSGAPLTCMMVLGIKVPINVGSKIRIRRGPIWFD